MSVIPSKSLIALPELIDSHSRNGKNGSWFINVPTIGTNGGFGSGYDWNDDFDDDDGALILGKDARFVDEDAIMKHRRKNLGGFMAVPHHGEGFAHLTFRRRAFFDGNVLFYDLKTPRIMVTSENRENGINMEASAVYAALGLQLLTDFDHLVRHFSSREDAWLIQPQILYSGHPTLVESILYEIVSVAIGITSTTTNLLGHLPGSKNRLLKRCKEDVSRRAIKRND